MCRKGSRDVDHIKRQSRDPLGELQVQQQCTQNQSRICKTMIWKEQAEYMIWNKHTKFSNQHWNPFCTRNPQGLISPHFITKGGGGQAHSLGQEIGNSHFNQHFNQHSCWCKVSSKDCQQLGHNMERKKSCHPHKEVYLSPLDAVGCSGKTTSTRVPAHKNHKATPLSDQRKPHPQHTKSGSPKPMPIPKSICSPMVLMISSQTQVLAPRNSQGAVSTVQHRRSR